VEAFIKAGPGFLVAACVFALGACSSGLTGGVAATGGASPTGGTTGAATCSSGGSGGAPTGTAAAAPGPWVDRTDAALSLPLNWTSVAWDSTGTHLVAAAATWTGLNIPGNGDLWASADAGITWTNLTAGTQASGLRWSSVASDATGVYLTAVVWPIDIHGSNPNGEDADVWTSADAGVTWTRRTTIPFNSPALVAPSLVSDASGAHLAVASGDVWTSADAGVTWTDRTAGTSVAGQAWVDLASDATGDHLVAATLYTDIWTSSDGGSTWTNRTQGTPASGLDWQGVASDATGTLLVAVANLSITTEGCLYSGDIWTSTDAGVTWTDRTKGTEASGLEWTSVASDAAGVNLVAAAQSGIWRSADSGATWTNETIGTTAATADWFAVGASATGTHFAAISGDGGLCCEHSIWTR
jgi:hypothetical protein